MNKTRRSRYALSFASFVCFSIALALMVLIRFFQEPEFIEWYNSYTDLLISFELWMQTYGASWISVAIILLNFALKSVIIWFPIPCMCVASAVLFPWYWAMAIDLVGVIILFSLKYFWGSKMGGGNAEKILSKYDVAHNFIDESKLGSTVVLFMLRLVPCIPINAVSQLYGTTEIKYRKYLIVSILGFTYKLVSYTIIGRNVFDPLSVSFVLPFVILALFSGVVLTGLNGIISATSLGKKILKNISRGKKVD
ncbi:MAG: VTT domain-containing protein [Clostridia bacterium]